MKEEYAVQVIEFFKEYNINAGNNTFEQLYSFLTLKEIDTSGRHITNLLNVNPSYFSHECNRKVPLQIRQLKRKGVSWIHFAVLLANKCPICNNIKKLENATCSTSCANTHFRSGKNNPNYKEEPKDYRIICFRYHKKECIICGEQNIVSVHHFDENHNNNSPNNLIPLCSTHHQYVHSNYKNLIFQQVLNYKNSLTF